MVSNKIAGGLLEFLFGFLGVVFVVGVLLCVCFGLLWVWGFCLLLFLEGFCICYCVVFLGGLGFFETSGSLWK